MIPIITGIISAFINSKVGQAKVPWTSQSVGQFVSSKTNNVAVMAFGFGVSMLTGDPDWIDRILGHVYTLGSLFAVTIKDAISKK